MKNSELIEAKIIVDQDCWSATMVLALLPFLEIVLRLNT